jgi:hypothetical protein
MERKPVTQKRDNTVFSDGKASWLLQNVHELDEDQRALLLAMVELDKDIGREMTDEEHAALKKLAAETQGFDPVEIQGAVKKMVKGKAKRKSTLSLPSNIRSKLKRARKK